MTPIEIHANEIYMAIHRAAAAGYRLVSFQIEDNPYTFLDLEDDDDVRAVVGAAYPTIDNETTED